MTAAMDLRPFVEAVGDAATGPVRFEGRGTAATVGGAVHPSARPVVAPAGVVWVAPEEMTVCCGAGTPVAELQAALAAHGQEVALPDRGGTVGGALAVGRADVLRLGRGPVRDTLLQARVVTAAGEEVKAGGPTVKNVSGYDLCRLLVGSLGTLAGIGEVILRTRPRPAERRWFHRAGGADPFALQAALHRPASVLWDGTAVWVCLDGHGADVVAQRDAHLAGFNEVDGPPLLPTGGRWSVRPSAVARITGTFVAEVGVGVVHHTDASPARTVDPAVRVLHERMKAAFDPTGRCNPGRSPLDV